MQGFRNFYVDAGGDVQVYGKNAEDQVWKVGICNPFDLHQIVKTVAWHAMIAALPRSAVTCAALFL